MKNLKKQIIISDDLDVSFKSHPQPVIKHLDYFLISQGYPLQYFKYSLSLKESFEFKYCIFIKEIIKISLEKI